MLAPTFNDSSEIGNAYEAALYGPCVDLVIIKGALGSSAVNSLAELSLLEDINERTDRLQAVLHNAMSGLEAAEKAIAQWSEQAGLPTAFRVFSSLEGIVARRSDQTNPHFDIATATTPVIIGPFAISIGTRGVGEFQGLRYPRRLTNEELTGEHPSPLETFKKTWTKFGQFILPVTKVAQEAGDIVLIPGSPHPSLHAVSVDFRTTGHSPRTSTISSYIMTTDWASTPKQLRSEQDEVRKERMRAMMSGFQGKLRENE